MRPSRFIIALTLACVLGAAESALAWGPAVHTGLAGSVLSQLSLVPAAVAAILARHGLAYLYGNIAADVVFAKRLSRIKQFCHHWSTAFRLLDDSADDAGRAFAYGYLSHLAADTVAHGKYVPRQIMVSGCTMGFGHLYWELRSDATESAATWCTLEGLLDEDHARHHQTLADHVADTFLSYRLNHLLFDGMNALTVHRSFRRTIDVWTRYSRWYLPPTLMTGYRDECLDRIHAILSEGRSSSLLREDPNGTSALMELRVRRREIRRLHRRGLPVKRRVTEAALSLAPRPLPRLGIAPGANISTAEVATVAL